MCGVWLVVVELGGVLCGWLLDCVVGVVCVGCVGC